MFVVKVKFVSQDPGSVVIPDSPKCDQVDQTPYFAIKSVKYSRPTVCEYVLFNLCSKELTPTKLT